MRMSCNGCRVLRKGCSDNCSIRPCLSWITSPDSQSNATLFLAKFYGRAGLLNLLNSGPDHLRPAIFRSLLYEACGRIVNPIYGSVGLLWSGKWHLCQSAVESVLKGDAIGPIDSGAGGQGPPLNAVDIRHVARDKKSTASMPRCCLIKRSSSSSGEDGFGSGIDSDPDDGSCTDELESVLSTETTAQNQKRPNSEVGLDLMLGLGAVSRAGHVVPIKKRRFDF